MIFESFYAIGGESKIKISSPRNMAQWIEFSYHAQVPGFKSYPCKTNSDVHVCNPSTWKGEEVS